MNNTFFDIWQSSKYRWIKRSTFVHVNIFIRELNNIKWHGKRKPNVESVLPLLSKEREKIWLRTKHCFYPLHAKIQFAISIWLWMLVKGEFNFNMFDVRLNINTTHQCHHCWLNSLFAFSNFPGILRSGFYNILKNKYLYKL